MAKLEELFLKDKRTPAENEQLRNYIRSLEALTRQPLGGKQEVYSKSEIDRLLGDIRKLITPASAPKWTFLTTALTNTSWDGDAFSTTAKTLLPLGTTFGVPSGCKAVLAVGAIRDSASSTNDCYLFLSPNNTSTSGPAIDCHTVNDRFKRFAIIVPCDANGDIYYQIAASGAGTMDIYLEIWGYYR